MCVRKSECVASCVVCMSVEGGGLEGGAEYRLY